MPETTKAKPARRRICWPPDATCLEGGCSYCADERPRNISSIEKWCKTAGEVPNRCGGKKKPAMKAFDYGIRHGGPGREA